MCRINPFRLPVNTRLVLSIEPSVNMYMSYFTTCLFTSVLRHCIVDVSKRVFYTWLLSVGIFKNQETRLVARYVTDLWVWVRIREFDDTVGCFDIYDISPAWPEPKWNIAVIHWLIDSLIGCMTDWLTDWISHSCTHSLYWVELFSLCAGHNWYVYVRRANALEDISYRHR